MPHQTILLHIHAPAKPALGAPCNGCGVCCASEPCPAGAWISGRRHGACAALQWDDAQARYRCGLVMSPSRVLHWLPRVAEPLARRLALRWIAAARGCDSAVEVSPGPDQAS